jgi:parallel beta-helix repeat protein
MTSMKQYLYGLLGTSFALINLAAFQIQQSQSGPVPPVQNSENFSSIQLVAAQTILYVDPKRGIDSASTGQDPNNPLKTITAALEKAQPGTVIQLAPGRYSAGEMFPLNLKAGVILRGEETNHGEGVVITGGGQHISRSWAAQNVTILAGENTEIRGITVTNPNTRGTGIWVENTSPLIQNNTFVNNNREGVFVSGNGAPLIENNQFMYNGGNGISVTRQASGEIKGNTFIDTGFALAIGHDSTPLILNNQIRQNRIGLVITQNARPTLQGNLIENNSEYGMAVIAQAEPEVAANNIFRNNERENWLVSRQPQGMPPLPEANDSTNGTTNSWNRTTTTTAAAFFSCQPYGDGFATIAQGSMASIPQPMIVWKTYEFDAPENRCVQSTEKLNQLVVANGGKLDKMMFATGRVNNDKAVCLVTDVYESCQPKNMVFKLSQQNADNSAEVLRRLIGFTIQGGGNPVQEVGPEAIAPLRPVSENLQPELGLWFVELP